MKQRVSFFGVIALVSALMFPSHFLLAEEIKTDKANATESQETDRVIGKVTFLTGQAEMTLRDGTIVPLEKSVEIMDGSRIAVKDRSKVHLKMIDEGIEKLEANTTFDFNAYAYDPSNPQANRISKTIWTGEVTSKTGKGGEDFKDRYRLNSPLAAIAVLGTEYTVRVVDGETQIVVHTGSISIAKLGGSCLSSGLGACAEGEILSESQRGFALVVRGNLSKPKLTPVSALPPLSQSEVPVNSTEEEPTKSDEKTNKQESVKKADTSAQETDGKSTTSATTETNAVEDKKTTTAVTESASTDKQAEATASVPSTTKSSGLAMTSNVSTSGEVDERDPLAELNVKTTTTQTSADATQNTISETTSKNETVTAVTSVTATEANTKQTTVSNQPDAATTFVVTSPALSTTSTVAPVTVTTTVVPESATTTPSTSTTANSALITTPTVVASNTALESTGAGLLTGGSTATSTTSALGGTSTSLLESASGSSTLTTPTGEVTPVVTSPPTVVPPPLVTAPTTPVVETTPLKVVEWGAHDPNATVDGSTTLSEQVNNNYKQVVLPNTGKYDFSMLENATAGLTDQRDATFMLSSYEAYMNNSATGTRTSAAVSNASLNVSPTRSTFDTQFNLSSPEYSGTVIATGPFSASNGVLVDDGSHPGTSIRGIVGAMGSSIGAGYEFNHQINPTLNAGGALSFTGSHVGN